MLSDFSVSKSEDGLDSPQFQKKEWQKHRPSTGGDLDPPPKKRRSSNKFVEVSLPHFNMHCLSYIYC